MRDPKCGQDCAVVIHGRYRSSEVDKSIIILIIDRNVYRTIRQNVSSVNMIKREDGFDQQPAIFSLIFTTRFHEM